MKKQHDVLQKNPPSAWVQHINELLSLKRMGYRNTSRNRPISPQSGGELTPKKLKELPEHAYVRDFYENLFVEMCERVARLQDNEGYWHASLLDPTSYPSPETSNSG